MLKERLLFGFIGICLLGLIIYMGGWLFNISVLILAILGTNELFKAFQKKGHKPFRLAGLLAVTLFYMQHYYFAGTINMGEYYHNLTGDYLFTFLAALLILALPLFIKDRGPKDAAITLLAFLYPGSIFIFAFLLRTSTQIMNNQSLPENFLLIIILFATFSTDTFAYFVGRMIGKRKLCPDISPNKTIEGSIGGLLGSMVVTLLVGSILNSAYKVNISPLHFISIGLICGAFSQVGDLTASIIKRYCNIKDYGNILPGHGGVMDRCDSLLFTMPIGYVYYIVFLI